MSAKRVKWEGPPLAQPPDSAAGRGAATVRGLPGVQDAPSEVTSAEDEGPKVTPLFEAPATPPVEPDRNAPAEPRRGKTVSEVPLWAAALTAVVLLGGLVTLGVFVARMNDELKSKARKGDLDAANAQIGDLKKALDRARAPAQPHSPMPANASTPAHREDSFKADGPEPEDSVEPGLVRQQGVDKTTASGNRTQRVTERRGSNRNSRRESATSNRSGRKPDAANSAQPPANVKTKNDSTAVEPKPASKQKPPAPAPSQAKPPAPTNEGQ